MNSQDGLQRVLMLSAAS